MKYERTPRFDTDFAAHQRDRRAFLDVVPAFAAACDANADDPTHATWPARLRITPMKSAPGVWEMTWSFASPDGRATFEFLRIDGEVRVRWRRIGDHSIYRTP